MVTPPGALPSMPGQVNPSMPGQVDNGVPRLMTMMVPWRLGVPYISCTPASNVCTNHVSSYPNIINTTNIIIILGS